MNRSSLWDSNDSDDLKLDLFGKPKASKRSGLFDEDVDIEQIVPTEQLNYKKMYESEHQRCLELENQVEELTARIRELEGLTIDQEEEKNKEARRIQQHNRQKRSAQASKRKGGTKTSSNILVSDDVSIDPFPESVPPASASAAPSLFDDDSSDSRVDRANSASRDGVLFDSVGEEIGSILRTTTPILPQTAAVDIVSKEQEKPSRPKQQKKATSLFDESSSDDSDGLFGRRDKKTKINVAPALSTSSISALAAATGEEGDEEAEEYLRQQEKIRLDKQIQRQKQLHKRTQRARGAAAGSRRTTVPKSSSTASSSATSKQPTSTSNLQSTVPGVASPAVGAASGTQKGPSLWSEDEDDSGSGQWSSSEEEEEQERPVAQTLPSGPPSTKSPSEVAVKCEKPNPGSNAGPDLSSYDQQAESAVLLWCRGKDLGALIYTLPDISLAPGLVAEELRSFDLSSPAHLRKAYL
jgi:hypothetical protein